MKRAAKVTAVLALICLVLGLGLSVVSLLLGARGFSWTWSGPGIHRWERLGDQWEEKWEQAEDRLEDRLDRWMDLF